MPFGGIETLQKPDFTLLVSTERFRFPKQENDETMKKFLFAQSSSLPSRKQRLQALIKLSKKIIKFDRIFMQLASRKRRQIGMQYVRLNAGRTQYGAKELY